MASQLQQMSDSVPQRRRLHLKEITNEGATDTIGGLLRATRQKLGEDLKSAARVTKIRPEYLEALEEGKPDKLPGRTYAIGFLKTYADFLGLDPAECVAKFKAEHAPPPQPEGEMEIGIKEPEPEMRVPQGTLVIVGVVIILLIYAGVYLFRSANTYMDERAKEQAAPAATAPAGPAARAPETTGASGLSESAQAPPGALPLPGTQGAASTASPTDEADTTPAEEEPGAQAPAEDDPGAQAVTDQTKPANAQGAPTQQPDAPTSGAPAGPSYEEAVEKAGHSFGAADGPGRLVLRATQNVFVRITTSGARQEIIHQGVLAKGDVFYVPAKDNLVLVTRNGGAVEAFLDKTYKGTLGPKGVALSNFALTPKSFER